MIPFRGGRGYQLQRRNFYSPGIRNHRLPDSPRNRRGKSSPVTRLRGHRRRGVTREGSSSLLHTSPTPVDVRLRRGGDVFSRRRGRERRSRGVSFSLFLSSVELVPRLSPRLGRLRVSGKTSVRGVVTPSRSTPGLLPDLCRRSLHPLL